MNCCGIFIIAILILAGCSDDSVQEVERLSATQVLASDDTDGYLRAEMPRDFSFPADHGPHPGYRNEWWYLTGNVETETGRRFGYQVTFFRSAIRPPGDKPCEDGNSWCTDQAWMGHAAITDVERGEHLVTEIFTRQEPGLAGASQDPLRVWLQNWQLIARGNDFPWELEVITREFSLALRIDAQKSPVLQGENGLSRKSPTPGNASYYYSITRLNTVGQVFMGGQEFGVAGDSWLDREWSTSALAADQSGWDWFSLQLTDNSELMYYQLRDLQGGAHANSGGNYTSLMGTQTSVTRDDIELDSLDTWTAPDGTVYTTEWRLRWRDNDWRVRAVIPDQLMDVTFQYWEGAVDVMDNVSGEAVGRGYLEMVR